MEFDGEFGCEGEILQNVLENMHECNVSFGEDQSIIRVLKHGTGKRCIHRVAKLVVPRGPLKKPLKHVGDDDE